MAVCIPTYTLAGSMIKLGMSWWQAVLTVALGNCIVLVPVILNGHPAPEGGISRKPAEAVWGTINNHIRDRAARHPRLKPWARSEQGP